jgi:phospholipase C
MRPNLPVFLLALTALTACAATSDDEAPNGAQESAWDAESADHEGDSTHLWIVNRAIDILARHRDDAVAARAVSVLDDKACRAQWQQGLLDADFKAQYNNGRTDMPTHPSDVQVALAGATWESHFYDPDTGKNYKGATSPTAFTEADSHIERAFANRLEAKGSTACYELGLALHYFTDLTQPMHATNFTALSRPAKLHSNLEAYAVEIQDRFPLADWSGKPRGAIKDFVHQTAKDSKPLFQAGVVAIVDAYNAHSGWDVVKCGNVEADWWRFLERQQIDHRSCWENNPGVDAMIGNTLKSAQDHTAKFIYLVAQRLEAKPAPY